MAEQVRIPPICYELLEVLHAHGGPRPYRSLPRKLQDVGLLKVCLHHGLIELVLWYEPNSRPSRSIRSSAMVVESLPSWLPCHHIGCSSVQDAIELDADCDDARKGLYLTLTDKGDLICETRRLSNSARTGTTGDTQRDTLDISGFTSADKLWHDHGIRQSRLSEGVRKGAIRRKAAPSGLIDSQGRRIRSLYNEEDAIRECSPKHRKSKTPPNPRVCDS
jgi:hypothetical protein